MAITNLTINFDNTITGLPQSADGMCLLLTIGKEVSTTFVSQTVYTLTSVNSLTDLGVNIATYDSVNSLTLVKQVTDFYTEAGDGTLLYLLFIDPTIPTPPYTLISVYVASDAFKQLLRLTGVIAGDPSPSSIVKIIGISFPPQSTLPVLPDVFYSDVIPTRNAIQLTLTQLEEEIDGTVFAMSILDGNNSAGYTTLPDQSVAQCNKVAFQISSSDMSSSTIVGQVLGILSRNKVSYNIGDVSRGALSNRTAYLNGVSMASFNGIQYNSIATKQYLFMRTRPQLSGYYYNDAPTCDLVELSLSTIQNNRVKQKLIQNAQAYFTKLINTNYVADDSGNIPEAVLQGVAASYFETYIQPMITNEEISQFGQVISNGLPNFITSKEIDVQQEAIPIGSVSSIKVNLSFTSQLT